MSGVVRDCFYVRTVVVKQEIPLIPTPSRDRPRPVGGGGVAWREGVAKREEVTQRGGAFGRLGRERRAREAKEKQKQRGSSCVEASERRLREKSCV